MSAKFIPPQDPASQRRKEQALSAIRGVLSGYISGRGSETKIERAAQEVVRALGSMLKMPSKPDKGATVMTEAASSKNDAGNYVKGPNNL